MADAITPLIPSKLLVSTAGLLFTLDLIGTFVFALSGAASGVKNKFDVFGIGVMAFVAGNAGGVIRDVLMGAVPAAAINDWHYVGVSLAAAAVTFVWYPHVKRLQPIVLLFDAAGLALFAVSGTQKALAFGIQPIEAALLGMLTGIGGGVLRDLLANEVPVVLYSELYAVAALAGAMVVVAGHVAHWSPTATTTAGAVLCFVLRLIAIRRGWNLPAPLPGSR
jgi:uncharacterized membrane protein YeiH